MSKELIKEIMETIAAYQDLVSDLREQIYLKDRVIKNQQTIIAMLKVLNDPATKEALEAGFKDGFRFGSETYKINDDGIQNIPFEIEKSRDENV